MRRWGNAEAETTCERFRATECAQVLPQLESEPVSEQPAPAAARPKSKTKRKG